MTTTKKTFGYWFGLVYTLITVMLTIMLAFLKITEVIKISWWVVFAPCWGSLAAAFLLIGISTLLVYVFREKIKDV